MKPVLPTLIMENIKHHNRLTMKIVFILLVALWLGEPRVFAQVTLENLMSPAFPSNMVSSKDGKRIAWISNEEGIRNIFGAEAPEFSARKLTQYVAEDGLEISSLTFSTSEELVFVKGGATNNQNESPNPLSLQENVEQSIWTVQWFGPVKRMVKGYYPKPSPDGKNLIFLSGGQVYMGPLNGSAEPKKLFQIRGSQRSLRWSPDGNEIAFISNRNDHAFLGVYNLKTSKIKFLDPSFDHDSNPVWSEDGKYIAYIRTGHVEPSLPFFVQREGYPWSIRTVDIASGISREVWRALPGKGSILFADVPNVDNLLFWIKNKIIFPWERTGWIHLYAVDDRGGEAKELTPGEGEIEHVSLTLDHAALLIVSNLMDLDRRHIWRVTPDGKMQQLSKGSGIEWAEAETSQGIVCLRSDAVTTAWPYQIAKDGSMKIIAAELFPKNFPKDKLVVPEAVMIKSEDGMLIPAQLFIPKDPNNGKRRPAIVFLHGGSRRQMLLGFNYGSYYHNAYSLNQYLASLGYIVLSVNYRSGIGYGLEFREALQYGPDGASEYYDVIGAGRYLQQRSDVDRRRIGLWGGSYGGFLTAHGLARNSDIFACGVDIHGVHNWNPVIKNFQPAYDPLKQSSIAKRAFESSPLNYVKGWKSPVLLIHGDDDRNVPFNESVTLLENLRKQNVYYEQLIFPDETHFFLLHESWLKAYNATAEFFQREFNKIK